VRDFHVLCGAVTVVNRDGIVGCAVKMAAIFCRESPTRAQGFIEMQKKIG